MKVTPNEVSVKAHMEINQVINYLEALISSLRNGRVYVEQGTRVVELTPGDAADVEIEAVVKKGKQKFSMELEWREKVLTQEDVGLKISSTKPEIQMADTPEIDASEDEADSENSGF